MSLPAPLVKLGDSLRKRVRRLLWRFWRQEGPAVRTRQGLFYLDDADQGVCQGLLRNGEYEFDDLRRLLRLVSPRSRALVVGAHIGAYAVPLAKACGALTLIEANPRSYQLLEKNLRANGCANARAINVAAAEKAGELEFVFNTGNSGGAKRMPFHQDNIYFSDRPEIGKVPCARLDDVLAGGDYEFILMDIEGSEYFAFLGMPRLLARARTLVVEFIPHHLERAANISVADFLAPLLPHFDELTLPSIQKTVGKDAMLRELQRRFDKGRGDLGLVFRKTRAPL